MDLDEGKGGNDMSFKITGPGFYRQRNGGKAEVFAEREGWWYGMDYSGDAQCWRVNGSWRIGGEEHHSFDIVDVWHDPPPTPPDGFQLMPRNYVAREGDSLWNALPPAWQEVGGCAGQSAEEMEVELPGWAPVYIASPIPKPDPGEGWRILRDYEIIEKGDEWCCPEMSQEWSACGTLAVGSTPLEWFIHRTVFVRRRVPKWVATNELRWRQPPGSSSHGDGYVLRVLEQKWTFGNKHEWRPIPVEVKT